MSRVWAVMFKEFGSAEEIVVERHGEGFRHLMYADTAEGYSSALAAFTREVKDRIGPGLAVFEYPGEIGADARAHIVVRDQSAYDNYGYHGDVVELRPIEVIAE